MDVGAWATGFGCDSGADFTTGLGVAYIKDDFAC
jgi:hypothetical protein